jgi:hypothetical protein
LNGNEGRRREKGIHLKKDVQENEQGESFVLKIDYEKDSIHPSRVFRAMSEMIEGFRSLDGNLVQAFPIIAVSVRWWLSGVVMPLTFVK